MTPQREVSVWTDGKSRRAHLKRQGRVAFEWRRVEHGSHMLVRIDTDDGTLIDPLLVL
jgi:hypothetical protein